MVAMMVETVITSETSVNFYETTHRIVKENSHLQHGARPLTGICVSAEF
jgi:hypothetical protein